MTSDIQNLIQLGFVGSGAAVSPRGSLVFPLLFLGLLVLMLPGCGESASEYHANEKRDESIQSVQNLESRMNELEARMTAQEQKQ
jgi:hypothetical protein